MINKERWEFNQEWLDYVNTHWVKGGGRVQEVKKDDDTTTMMRVDAREAFERNGYPHKRVRLWISIQEPNAGDGYEKGYPHVHWPASGVTLVHYLDPGDIPAPLHILENGEVVEEVYPEAGLTVFMPNDVMHGVLHNNGRNNRVQIVATGLPS